FFFSSRRRHTRWSRHWSSDVCSSDLALRRRFPAVAVLVYPTAVQGPGSAEEIARTLALADKRAECDVLILTRGGGSLEDLWAFNEEAVARAIAAVELPIIVGV